MTRTVNTIIRTLGTFLSCCVVAAGFVYFGYSLALAEKYKQDGNIQAAYYTEKAERHRAMRAYIELEAKRTTVQTEIRGMVIAELRKCKRGKC